jgi:type IV secretory pathway VirB9-like protein
MKQLLRLFFLAVVGLQAQTARKPAKPVPAAAIIASPPEAPPVARTFAVNDKQTVVVNTKLRYDTWIVLPREEAITEAGTGDPDNWSIKAADEKHPTNLVHVKPAEANSRTNLHLRTASGHIYSFLLTEVSGCPTCQPDLKMFVESAPDRVMLAFQAPPAADQKKQIDELMARVQALREQANQAKRDARAEIVKETTAFRATYPLALRCDYRYEFNRAPFYVGAICTDGVFTYIKSAAEEMPSLYMEKDGKPALVKFDFRTGQDPHQGTYVIDSAMTSGYLQLGRKKLKFHVRS